jgi:NAD(P)-dependent dehydrogenase (short-subunit alcohol dehydrogenase family)
MTKSRERTALVVGAASGMGRIHARRLASRGLRVAIADRDEEGLVETNAGHPEMLRIKCDVTDLASVQGMVRRVLLELGSIDRVVHTAGVMPTALLSDASPDDVKRVMRVNYEGVVNVVSSVLPSMRAAGRGRVVVYGSVAGYALTPHLGAYCASKAAANAYVEILSEELAGTGVDVHLVCPPMVDTPLIKQARDTSNPKSIQQATREGMLADPEKVVDAVDLAVEKDQRLVFPLATAKALHLARRLAPRLLWKVIRKSEEM